MKYYNYDGSEITRAAVDTLYGLQNWHFSQVGGATAKFVKAKLEFGDTVTRAWWTGEFHPGTKMRVRWPGDYVDCEFKMQEISDFSGWAADFPWGKTQIAPDIESPYSIEIIGMGLYVYHPGMLMGSDDEGRNHRHIDFWFGPNDEYEPPEEPPEEDGEMEIIGLDGQPTDWERLEQLYGDSISHWDWTPPCYKLVRLEMVQDANEPLYSHIYVRDEFESPVEGVVVSLVDHNDDSVRTFTTMHDGKVSIVFTKDMRHSAYNPGRFMIGIQGSDGVDYTGRIQVSGGPDRVLNYYFQWKDEGVEPPDPEPDPEPDPDPEPEPTPDFWMELFEKLDTIIELLGS